MKIGWAAAAAALALLVGSIRASASPPIPPSPTHWATDSAGFISSGERDALNAQLKDFEAHTGHQVLVWIGHTTGDSPLEEWTVNAFAKWKVGRKGLDDGAVLFILADDRKIRIEVGYGLEGVLTDAKSSEIIRNVIAPKLRSGDRDGAVQDGADAILAAIGNPGAAAAPSQPTIGGGLPTGLILVFIILLMILFVRSPAFAGWMLYTIASGGRASGPFGGSFSGGGGFGGGFSGGGGMSGGGGASGSW